MQPQTPDPRTLDQSFAALVHAYSHRQELLERRKAEMYEKYKHCTQLESELVYLQSIKNQLDALRAGKPTN